MGVPLDQQRIFPLRFAPVEMTGVSFRYGRDEAKLFCQKSGRIR
jgi:hypothetical protein